MAATVQGDILIVDDVPINLRLLTQMLTKQGHKVRPVTSGAQALAAARSTPPDLILLDIMMPGMNGYEVCEHLKADEQTRDIPIIFISALKEAESKLKGFTAGGVDYVTKPFWAEEVLARVETHLTLRTVQRRLEEQNAQLEQEINLPIKELGYGRGRIGLESGCFAIKSGAVCFDANRHLEDFICIQIVSHIKLPLNIRQTLRESSSPLE